MKRSLGSSKEHFRCRCRVTEVRQETWHLPDRRGHGHGLLHFNDGASLVNAMDQDGCPTLSVVHTTWPIECEFAMIEYRNS